MIELTAALEATALAQFLKSSRYVYPLINAGHIFGIALLIGSVIPLDLTISGIFRKMDPVAATALLRPVAMTGLVLAVGCGLLLFITQASDYIDNTVFLTKMVVLSIAVLNAAFHFSVVEKPGRAQRVMAMASLALWPCVLLLGRMVGYSIG